MRFASARITARIDFRVSAQLAAASPSGGELEMGKNAPQKTLIISKAAGFLRHVSGSTKSKVVTYSISAVILPLTFFNVTVSMPASFT